MKKLLLALALLASCHAIGRPVRPRTIVPHQGAPVVESELPGKPLPPDSPLVHEVAFFRQVANPGDGVEVIVRLVPMQDPYLGETESSDDGSRFVISIRDDVEPWIQGDILLHEWAHVLASNSPDRSSHGALWGYWFSYLYSRTRGMQW